LSFSTSTAALLGSASMSGTSSLTFTVTQTSASDYPYGNMVAGAFLNLRQTLQLNQDYY
jgi:hypothetical protein